MIKGLITLNKFLTKQHSIISVGLRSAFSKQAKDAKKPGGKKQEPVKEQIVEPKLEQLISKWMNPTYNSLSPTEAETYINGFSDISESDKKLLDNLAQKILDLPTAIFYDAVYKKGILGTSEVLYVSTSEFNQAQVNQRVLSISKLN